MQNKERKFYFVLCLIGAILGLVMIGMSGKQPKEQQEIAGQTIQSGVFSDPKVARMLESMEDVSSVSVMLQIDSQSEVTGVAVICENGEDPVIQEKITRLLRALYGIGAHQISVSG